MDDGDGPVVRPEELQEAGAACADTALEPAAVAASLRAVADAGGGGAGPAAAALADRWEAAVARWYADLAAHGEALAAAAEAYRASDADAAATLAGPGRPDGGR